MRNVLYLHNLYTKEKLIFRLFYASVVLGIIILFMGVLSGPISVLTVLSSALTGFAGIILYAYYFPTNKYTKWLFFLLIYFLIVGVLYGSFNPRIRGGDFTWIVTQDLRYVMYFMIGSIFAKRKYMFHFHKIMQFLGVSSIVAAVFGLIFFDFNIQTISDRTDTWSFSYYCWWLSAACFAYWGYYAIIVKKEKLLGFGVILSYFILGILFLKRSAFVNVMVLLFVGNILSNRNYFKSFGKMILLIIAILFFFILINTIFQSENIGELFNLLFNRFEMIEGGDELDRIIEWRAYYLNASVPQLIFGNGIGHYPFLQITENFSLNRVNALHIGFYNILFKGGILYVVFYIILYYNVFGKIFRLKALSKYELVCLGVAISAFISLFYEGSWGYTLIPFCISTPIFYIALSKR